MVGTQKTNARFHQYARRIPEISSPYNYRDEGLRLAALAFLLLAGSLIFFSGAWGGPALIPGVLGNASSLATKLIGR